MNGVSVVICTYNGAGRLPQCLDALSKCDFEQGGEIILVDNNSTDNSAVLAAAHWAKIKSVPAPLRIVREVKQGLAWARRTGAQAAQYNIIVYCDDDNLLAPNYLRIASGIMSDDPTLGAIGGAGILKTNGSPPPHFYNFARWFGVGAQIRNPEDANVDQVDISAKYPDMSLWGAGLVLRRADFLQLAGVMGFPILTGEFEYEDIELCHALALMGKRLVYSSRLHFKHALSADRLAISRLQRRMDFGLRALPVLTCYQQLRNLSSESPGKTVTHFPWRFIRAVLSRGPLRPLWFGLLTRCRLSCLMTMNERSVYFVFKGIESARRADAITA